MAGINTPKGLSNDNNFETVYEKLDKYPEIKDKLIQKIESLASNLKNLKNTNPKSIYENFFDTKYEGTSKQLARVFSFIFRENKNNIFEFNTDKKLFVDDRKLLNGARLTYLGDTINNEYDGKIEKCIIVEYEDENGVIPNLSMPTKYLRQIDKSRFDNSLVRVNLNNKNSKLNVRNVGNLNDKISKLKHGTTITNLGRKKYFNGLTYILVEFFDNEGNTTRGYISESHTTDIKQESSKALDLYIRSLGLNPTFEFKKELYKKVDIFLNYRGDYIKSKTNIDRDNELIFDILINNYELKRFIEIQEAKLQGKIKKDNLKNELGDIPHKTRSKGLKKKNNLIKKKNSNIENEKTQGKNEILNQKVLGKLRNNKKIVNYLEKKYKSNDFDQNLSSLKKKIGYKKNNFRDNVMTFTYLYQKANAFFLDDYYKLKFGISFRNETKKRKNDLFQKYVGKISEKYSNSSDSHNMIIFRLLIIENELGNEFISGVEREKSRDIYPVLSRKMGNWVVNNGPYNSGEDSCGLAIKKLNKGFGLPFMSGHGYQWEDQLNKKTKEGYFTKIKIDHPDEALPGGYLVFGRNARKGTSIRKKYGHVEIKGANNKYYSYYSSSIPGGSAKSKKKGDLYKIDTAFTGYVYYPVKKIGS